MEHRGTRHIGRMVGVFPPDALTFAGQVGLPASPTWTTALLLESGSSQTRRVRPVMVRRTDLGPLSEIASGSFGRVFRASHYTLPDGSGEAAFKEFTSDFAQQARAARNAVDLWDRLGPRDRAAFAEHTAWPRAVVQDQDGKICGLVMPLLARLLLSELQHTVTGEPTNRPREMSWLISTAALRKAAGVDIPEIDLVERHVLLAKLTYALGLLHRLRWVYGDLSFKNLAFALDPPEFKLLDCDASAPLADPNREQSHTNMWHPPEYYSGQQLQDTRTDVYKLGLAILRCLTPGMGASNSRDPARLTHELDGDGVSLVRRSLSSVPSERPEAKELYIHFAKLLRGRIAPPHIARARLLTPFRLRGPEDVMLEWQVEDAHELVVEAANRQYVEVDPSVCPDGMSFRPNHSGSMTLEARNRFGSVRAELGDVTLYELPEFRIGEVQLPTPTLPPLAPVSLHAAATVLSELPSSTLDRPTVPPEASDVAALMSRASPEAGAIPHVPRVDRAAFDATEAVRHAVTSSGADLASIIHDAAARASSTLGPLNVGGHELTVTSSTYHAADRRLVGMVRGKRPDS